MKMKSKIKSLFSNEMRHDLAAICDTKRIEKNTEKMDLTVRLLRSNGITFDLLGGATNRIVVMMDGYAIKIAMDRQGFKDNLMEYALTMETQPYTTKSYETNGYILVQGCIRLITIEEWRARKPEIIKILDTMSSDYLLGDVGYYDLNMTNWGIADDGSLKILDYAYCHRLTEELFTCRVCGSILSYDMNYVNFICTDRANCHEKYSYNDIKSIQGDTVDWELIEEKKRDSVLVPEGADFIDVVQDSDILLDNRTMVIRSYRDLERYKEEKKMTKLDMSNPELLDYLSQYMMEKLSGNVEYAEELLAQVELSEEEIKRKEQLNFIMDPAFVEKMEYDMSYHGKLYQNEEEQETVDEECDGGDDYSFDNLLNSMINRNERNDVFETIISEDMEQPPEGENDEPIVGSFNILDVIGIGIPVDEPTIPDSYSVPLLEKGDDRAIDVETSVPNEDGGNTKKLSLEQQDGEDETVSVPVSKDSIENGDDGFVSEVYSVVEDCGSFTTEPITTDPESNSKTEQVLVYMTGDSPKSNIVLDQMSLKNAYEELYAEEGVY